jgi:hypothetical protein
MHIGNCSRGLTQRIRQMSITSLDAGHWVQCIGGIMYNIGMFRLSSVQEKLALYYQFPLLKGVDRGPLVLSSIFTRRAVEQFLWKEVKCFK